MKNERTLADSRLPSLTGLRFVAALLVFFFHLSVEKLYDDSANPVLSKIFNPAGGVGVSFFFILSGFVLAWSAKPNRPAREFLRRRLAKIYPNHLLLWVLTLPLLLLFGEQVAAGSATANLALVQTWIPRLDFFFSVNRPSWSLCCELFFYLMFPLLARFVGRLGRTGTWTVVAATVAGVWLLPVVAGLLHGGPGMPLDVSHPELDSGVSVRQYWLVYAFPVSRCLEFLLGIAVAKLVKDGAWPRIPVAVATGLLAIGYAAAVQAPVLYGLSAITVIPLTLFIPAVTMADLEGRKSPLRSRSMVWLGEVSFAFYLVHQTVLRIGHDLLGHDRSWNAWTASALAAAFAAVTLLIAWAVYRWWEMPAMRLLTTRRSSRKSVPVAAGGPLVRPGTEHAARRPAEAAADKS
ncbi:acyltransferase family protein [Streptomyces telluris]|uniref:Acyltransferase n=1 Tax=Streptomyces telluris TaxID=2720021 RepID=A0A9X2RQL4_9ACTN|nr:acyltransferase [Streptomyces telluris]MCQ8772440.1 acyltransferase [Streptomyces telluris]NJP78033.1 acyltransferase [Streptomyces telluris]